MTYVPGDCFDYWMRLIAAVGSVGTAAGVIVALVSFIRTRRADRESREEQNRLAAERNYLDNAKQALQVVQHSEYDHDSVRTSQDAHVRVIITIENRSDDPIYDLNYIPESPLGLSYGQESDLEPKLRILAGGKTHRAALVVHATTGIVNMPRRPLITLDFTGRDGARWRRPAIGKPVAPPENESYVQENYGLPTA